MKLLAFIGCLQKAGAERVMSLLINEAASQGHDVTLLIGRNVIEYEIDKRINVVNLDTDSLNPMKRFKKVRGFFKRERPEVIVSFMSSASIYACLCGIGLGIPVVISERNSPEYEVPDKAHAILRHIAYHFATGAIFQTEQARDYFFKRLRVNSVVIPNPVRDDLPIADRQNVKREIVTLGRLDPQKNHKMLLSAFAVFLKAYPDYTLKIYGRGVLKYELEKIAESLNISDKVILHNPIDNVHEEIKTASMFVLSSDYEGISNALLECMAMGLPCISTDCPCGGSRGLIEDGVNGLLVPVGDAAAFCRAMERVAGDNVLANKLGEKARNVNETHGKSNIVGKYLDYLFSLKK